MAEVDVATARGEELVGFCAICGVEFDGKALTNRFTKCDSCDSVFQVRVRSDVVEE